MNERALVRVLRTNATFSGLSGVAFLLFAQPIAVFMGGFPAWICEMLGIGLLLFAADVFWITRANPLSAFQVKLVIAADLSWIVATPLVMVLFRDHLNLWGELLLLDMAIAVAVLAFFQIRFLARREALS